jgi:hypothetical protein
VESLFSGLGVEAISMMDADGALIDGAVQRAGEGARRDGWAWIVLLAAGTLAIVEMFVARVVSHAGRMFGADAGLGRAV